MSNIKLEYGSRINAYYGVINFWKNRYCDEKQKIIIIIYRALMEQKRLYRHKICLEIRNYKVGFEK